MKRNKPGILPLFLISLTGIFFSCGQKGGEGFTNSAGIRMVGISPGKFMMGDLQGDGQWDEQPVRKVRISRPFHISETEITVEQFRQFRPGYSGFESYAPFATGISWSEAMEYCAWLSEQEGKTYRLPTEAEWEYACRAGNRKAYSSGDQIPDHGTANGWGVKNMHTGALEWCYDYYGPYPPQAGQTDPVGPDGGFARVVRGGLPDDKTLNFDHGVNYYSRSSNRASLAPAFNHFMNQEDQSLREPPSRSYDQYSPGLTGILFDDEAFQKPLLQWRIRVLDSDQLNWFDRTDMTSEWRGYLNAPHSGSVHFHTEASTGIRLIIDGDTIIEGWGRGTPRTGSANFEKGIRYPLVVQYLKKPGDKSFMRIFWSWEGTEQHVVSPGALSFNMRDDYDMRIIFNEGLDKKLREPSIGFRVVCTDLPASDPIPRDLPFSGQGIRQETVHKKSGPDQDKPYFRKRALLPMPPDNREAEHTSAAGVDPYFSWHNHNPALTVCPNGDLLFMFFTANYEDEPEVAYGITRLRFGADEWDWPGRMIDFADVNDVAPLLWNDGGTIWMFFSSLHLDATYPFQWIISGDNGATWSEVKYPEFINRVGTHTPQPITSAFRDREGTIYFGCDGLGPESLLFASRDNGRTWFDTGGRTFGRHSVFVPLKDGSITAYGGKHSEIDGYMPRSVSFDNGKTWQHSKTPFPALGSSQRPALIRLESGRLFFAGDLQRIDGYQPPGFSDRGSFVALSEDEGETWHIKKLAGGQPHESEMRRMSMQGSTLGYAIARQAPNGMIHLIATMTDPCLHYEFNEAWILDAQETGDGGIMENTAVSVECPVLYREKWPDGSVRLEYHGGIANDGRFLKHGPERWFYDDGSRQYKAEYELGEKKGIESYCDRKGQKLWEWTRTDSLDTWRQWWPGGGKKAESTWINGRCEGMARTWDRCGKLVSEEEFENGWIKGEKQERKR